MKRLMPAFRMITAAGFVAAGGMSMADGAVDDALKLEPADFTTANITLDGKPVMLKRYEAVYVGRPVDMATEQPERRMGAGGSPSGAETQSLTDLLAYQKLVIFVPEGAGDSAAMILNVNNGGWFASELRPGIEDGGGYVSNSDTDKAGAALAAEVDTKAAIRFLRLNDAALPGSADRIMITGTSGGGGLSSVVAASGNSPDFFPYLAEVGAAGIAADGTSSLSDDVFAVIAYCPITDLGNADIAYEWLYRGIRMVGNTAESRWSDVAQAASAELAAAYPAYLATQGLSLADGTPLTADIMKDAIAAEIAREVERHLASGGTVPARDGIFNITLHGRGGDTQIEAVNDWLTVDGGVVTQLDIDPFLRFVAQTSALKNVPAFDRTANSGNEGIDGENSLFGGATVPYANFSAFGWNINEVAGDGSGADDTGQDWSAWTTGEGQALAAQVELVNPMAYLGSESKAAPHWYIRHGMIDRDASFTVALSLAAAARDDADVKDVNFALHWMTAHSGNYDVQAAYAWLADALASAE